MNSEYLSNIELYYTVNVTPDGAEIGGDEFNHLSRVMRHKEGDEVHFTDGKGRIYAAEIQAITKVNAYVKITKAIDYDNPNKNIFFCIPVLKNPDRLEFCLEKCIELGITNFIFYSAERSAPKKVKLERLEKIAIGAMKQTLLSYLPSIIYLNNLNEIINQQPGIIIGFEQGSDKDIKENLPSNNNKCYFIFGPEGGLTNKEHELIGDTNFYNLARNRLRTETAVIKMASLISL